MTSEQGKLYFPSAYNFEYYLIFVKSLSSQFNIKNMMMMTNNVLGFIGGLGGTEVMLILLAILLLFGAKKIPELARGLGKGIREFKDATKEIKNDIENSAKEDVHTKEDVRTKDVQTK